VGSLKPQSRNKCAKNRNEREEYNSIYPDTADAALHGRWSVGTLWKGKVMRNLFFAAAVAMLGMTTASFAGGPTGGTGTNEHAQPDSAMSGSSSETLTAASSASVDGIAVLPPSGGKGGYPARESNGCSAPGTPQSTGGSIGLGC
jgi:hypothetical protein